MGVRMISVLIPRHRIHEHTIAELVSHIVTVFKPIMDFEIVIKDDLWGNGKGWALREALKKAKGDYIALIDGDMDIHPRMFERLIPFLQDYDIVVGSKRLLKAPLQRRILTRLSRIYIRFVFGVKADTQTGIKIFKRSTLPTWEIDGFMFDLEILAKAHMAGHEIVEVPVEATISKTVAGRTICKSLMDSLKLKFRLLFHANE